MKSLTRIASVAALSSAAALFSAGTNAVTLVAGDATTILWQYTNVDGANLDGRATFTLTSLNGTTATFSVAVANNTTSAQPGTNRLVSFGIFDIDPNISAAAITTNGTTETWGVTRNTNFPGFQQIELCVWAGQNCSGGGSAGLAEGETDLFTLTLTGIFSGNISFGSPYPSKWQAVGNRGGSWELGGCIDTGNGNCDKPPPPPEELPEPGTLALLGLGLLGLAGARRRKL